MKNSKLFTLLDTFDLRDWQQFGQYLRSPFFNQTESLIRLGNALEDLFRKTPPEQQTVSKRAIFEQACPGQAYSVADFNRLCSRLLQLASGYLAYQTWQSDGILAEHHMLQACQARQLEKHFHFAWQKAGQLLQAEELRNIRFYQDQYLLSEVAEWQAYGQKPDVFGPKAQRAADDFDHYFVTQKLQHLCLIASLDKLQPGRFQLRFAEEVIAISGQLQHFPIIDIYRSLYLMLTGDQAPDHFARLKSLAVQHEVVLAQRELHLIYLALINFCIGRIRYGEKDFATPLLELYEKALEKEILLDKGMISPWTFKNVVKLGLGLQHYDWVERFIHQYAPRLAEKDQTEALHFNLAELYYHQKDFERAQLQLREVEFSDVRYYVHGRILLAKIYYTSGAWDALDSLLSTFRIYLMRSKKMSRDEKRPYLNFIRILDQLLRRLPEKQAGIRDTILKTAMLTDRSWLLEMVDQV